MTILEQLIRPTAVGTFLSETHGRRWLHHSLGLDTLRTIFGPSIGSRAFLDHLAQPSYRGSVTATYFTGRFVEPGDVRPRSFGIKPTEAETAFWGGLSVIGELDRPEIWRAACHLRRDMNHCGEMLILGSLSPRGDAYHAHIDPVDSFKIQVEGSKRWLLSPEPILPAPRQSGYLHSSGTLGYLDGDSEAWENIAASTSNLIEVVLQPGDVLYVPPGMVHSTCAEEQSFSFDIGFAPVSPLDVIRTLLGPVLRQTPAWRHMPVSASRDGNLPPEVRTHLASRIRELRDALEAINLDGPDVNRAWKKMVSNPGERGMAALSAGRPAATGAVDPDQELAVSDYAPIAHAWDAGADAGPAIDVFQAETHLSVPGSGAAFLRAVLEARRFPASSAQRFGGADPLPWEDVEPYLAVLLQQGLLEPAR